VKKQYDWAVKIPPAYPTKKDHDEMCKMLEGAKIIRAKPSKLNPKEVIITTEER
jgi:hypothetical protein